jgi:Photosynthesis system II assembly factor YCF48/Putative zinc-finger
MASNGHDTTMDGLIRRGLSKVSAPGGTCPRPEMLAAYYERSLDSAETDRFETHLSRCASCREQLALIVRAEEQPQPLSSYSACWRDWRLLASAAAALLVLTVWGVRRPEFPRANSRNADQPLVAMSRPTQEPAPQIGQPQPPPQTPPAAPETKLIAPLALDRTEPKAQSKQKTETPQIAKELQAPLSDKQLSNLPVNGRNFESLQQLRAGNERSATAELKKESRSEPAPPAAAPSPAAPTPMSTLAAPSGASAATQSATVNSNELADDKSKAADSLRAKEDAPGRIQAFGAVIGGTLNQAAGQRSTSTIIQTPDPKVLWRIAGGNFVERTEDGGATWHGQVADPDAELSYGSAPTTKICWLVGKSGMILLTKDTTHWKKISPPVPADFVSIEAKNGSSATVTAADGQKFSTDNEGKKWVPAK